MARKTVVTWPVLDTAAICALQTTAGAASFLMNGTQVQALNPNSSTKVFRNFNLVRTVSLTSTGNISGVNFTITGLDQFGKSQSEVLAGPNNNTVYSVNYYSQVNSVSVNGAVGTNTSVGTGTTGFTIWQKYNYHDTINATSVAVNVTGTINYSLQATLDDPATVSSPFIFTPNYQLTSATTSLVGTLGIFQTYPYTGAGAPTYDVPIYIPTPFDYYNLVINSSNATGTLTMTTIQQGIT